MGSKANVIVVGGGLAGLMATLKAFEAGCRVQLFSLVPVKRSHSVCAQGGINGALNTKGEGDSTWEHFDDSIYGGDFLANQTPVKNMCEAAPEIIYIMDRMGVMFNRTPEGNIELRRLGGAKNSRSAFAGSTTGQQLLYALDEQVRRFEASGLVKKFEGWQFLSVILDSQGICSGICAQNLSTGEVETFPADAVILATGGPGMVFGRTTMSIICTGYPASQVYQQGVYYANGEFVQFHPTAIPGEDKNRLMSESARGEGGRVWTYKEGKPWYFLEEWYPAYGNLVPRDIASRAIFKVCVEMSLGLNGNNQVYLDLSHKDPGELERKLGGILDIYEKFVGEDAKRVPMKIFPAVHYFMGGLWVDFNQMTNIPGLFACGEVDYQYHGANRLGGNSLMSSLYGGAVTGKSAANFIQGRSRLAGEIEKKPFLTEQEFQMKKYEQLFKMQGRENPYSLHNELGNVMLENVGVVRYNKRLQEADQKIQELMERYQNINVIDSLQWNNQAAGFARDLWHMLVLSRVITLGALNRNESRGAHYKPEFPQRDDINWLKTTKAAYTPSGPRFSYEEVDLGYIKPRLRKYDVEKKQTG
ncbi:MAG: succinate dehydrogenase flavoprotein subunit [Desulfitobacteriaceae bacterium]|nr:succinate dehydrogenase flavoprotein subunit [Desulfitobacteriaceae bacterium]